MDAELHRDTVMGRRTFLAGLGSFSVALGVPLRSVGGATASGDGPYGPLDDTTVDEHGLVVPSGFVARVIGESGRPVPGTRYSWPAFPDGAATFATEGGWIHVCNSEVLTPVGRGGVSAVRFSADGEIVDARSILEGTTANCAGGPTPWGTWLSCEEVDGAVALDADGRTAGLVWETDPTGEREAVPLPAMGAFQHEAVAVDPVAGQLYLTEDQPDGRLYRFTPDAYPDLGAGRLQAAKVHDDGTVTWLDVDDPGATEVPVRAQVPEATTFPGGEGIWYHDGVVVFTTKLDVKVHEIDVGADRHRVLYAASELDRPALDSVDNITVHAPSGDVFVAEDGSEPAELVVLAPDGSVSVFARLAGDQHRGSEVTGPCFSPAGDRLYVSSQRGGSTGQGITFEVSGPFRELPSPSVEPTTTIAAQGRPGEIPTTTSATTSTTPGAEVVEATPQVRAEGGGFAWTPVAVGGAAAGLATAWVVDRRRRRARRPAVQPPDTEADDPRPG